MAANKRRPGLELPSDVVRVVPPEYRELADTIQHRLKYLDELIESAAGFRGTVKLAKQKKKDERGHFLPGLTLEGNRIAQAADPKDPQDLVTFAYLKKLLTCERLSEIMSDCWEFSEVVDDAVETAPAKIIFTFFWGYSVFRIGGPQVTSFPTANQTSAWQFPLTFDVTISKVSFEITTIAAGKFASLGLYDDKGSLVLTSGLVSIGTLGKVTATIAPLQIRQGMYYLALTANSAFSYTGLDVDARWASDANTNSVKTGKGTASSGGALNSALGSLTAITNRPPVVLFE